MPTPDDVKARVRAAYNSAADYYDHPANAFWDRYGLRTAERLDVGPGDRVLDACCGAGASALAAAKVVGSSGYVLGIDLAAELLAVAREKAEQNGLDQCDLRVADLLELNEPSGSFDCAVCVFGVFFLPDMPLALRTMWSFVRPGGSLAITTWGAGVFDPVGSLFWDAVRHVRPHLYKSFNAWDRLGEPTLVEQLFVDAGLPAPAVTFESGTHPVATEREIVALLMGTGYRGTLEQLSANERAQVIEEVVTAHLAIGGTTVRTDVIYATCRKRL